MTILNQLLLVIDAQQELIDGNTMNKPVYNKEQFIVNVNKVINSAKVAGIPIVFIRDLDVANGEGNGFQVHSEIQTPPDARFFDKSATNSFYGTGLLEHLRSLGIGHIIIMGCETQHCIDSAVRTATINGFDATLVGDGHSTAGNTVLSPKQIIDHHNVTLHGHYNVDHFSVVRKADDDLFQPIHDQYR